MDRNILRLCLAGAAAFYMIVGGLFLQAYIPLARFYDRVESTSGSYVTEFTDQQMQDTLSYSENEMKVQRYGSLLLWGTVGIVAFGGVVMATRQRRRSGPSVTAQGDTK